MTTINFGSRVSLKEAAELIAAVGATNRVMLQGEKGIGKSSIMKLLPQYLHGDYEYAYVDCGNMELGDVAVPFPDRESKETEFFPSAVFKLSSGKPVVIMLDEFGKAPRPVQNMLHPLLELNKPRLGNKLLPEGSIVFLTTNLAEEGIGDVLLDHTLDRITRVEVRKPSPREWLEWGVENDIHPALLAWVDQTPQVLSSFRDEDFDQDNPYVYNPKRFQGKFITPRSLQLASNIMWQREKITDNSLTASLIGTVGEAGARDLQSYLAFQDELPKREDILAKPDTTPIPESVAVIITLLFNLERVVDEETITPIMTYVCRMETEHQAVFCTMLARSKTKQRIAFRSKEYTKWAALNSDIL
jgi:hypothetical protein